MCSFTFRRNNFKKTKNKKTARIHGCGVTLSKVQGEVRDFLLGPGGVVAVAAMLSRPKDLLRAERRSTRCCSSAEMFSACFLLLGHELKIRKLENMSTFEFYQ